MTTELKKTTNQLNKIASRALERPHSERLLWDILIKRKNSLNFDHLFLPEALSIGIKTSLYKDFNEEQRLFLNHLAYFVHYFRINGAEKIAIQNNIAIANSINSEHMAKYLLLEVEEEKDHIKTFSTVFGYITSHYE